jgi:hypothetical protein
MRLHDLGVFVLASAVTVGAQSSSDKKPAKPVKTPTPIALPGCVQRGESAPDQYTLSESKDSQIYHLTGPDLREYVGRRVRILGAVPNSKRLRVVGGLTPSPNVAAQAGAMDPSRAVVAGATAAGSPGRVELPEFKVKSVRPVSGSCSQ